MMPVNGKSWNEAKKIYKKMFGMRDALGYLMFLGTRIRGLNIDCSREKIYRPEGPIVSRPGRQAGNRIESTMSAEDAALRTLAGAGPSGLIPWISVHPELTLGAIHCRRFAPRFRFFLMTCAMTPLNKRLNSANTLPPCPERKNRDSS